MGLGDIYFLFRLPFFESDYLKSGPRRDVYIKKFQLHNGCYFSVKSSTYLAVVQSLKSVSKSLQDKSLHLLTPG